MFQFKRDNVKLNDQKIPFKINQTTKSTSLVITYSTFGIRETMPQRIGELPTKVVENEQTQVTKQTRTKGKKKKKKQNSEESFMNKRQ